jgi:hypothetical protein
VFEPSQWVALRVSAAGGVGYFHNLSKCHAQAIFSHRRVRYIHVLPKNPPLALEFHFTNHPAIMGTSVGTP